MDEDDQGKPINNLVVGIAGNARKVKREDPDGGESYFAADPADMANMALLVKTAGAPEALVSEAG